ncbi:cytochrome P450 [Massarina eburnea CBS 473.64]|uniref:Cytochrome P450 n=1 Tax=Massarina eburnea CBS 473.64 TaxID=1395130 RepID=A0A6A6RL19_9PLEO|nr:cytochrome P450 [Massarina eburnea CBS 473.64]
MSLAFILLITAFPLLSRAFASKSFPNGGSRPAIVPSTIPLLSHTWTFVLGGSKMAAAFLQTSMTDGAIRFKGIGFDMTVLSGPKLIRKALISPQDLHMNIISANAMGNLFGAPKALCDAIITDNSGNAAKPIPGTQVPLGRRFARNQGIFFKEAFAKRSLDEIIPRFTRNLYDQCELLHVGTDWVEMDNLFDFVHCLVFPSAVKSFFGDTMLQVNPNLLPDFRAFEDQLPFLAMGLPVWMKPQAQRARTKCLDAMKRWRQEATKTEEPLVSSDQLWDSAWGLGAIRRFRYLFKDTDGIFGEDAWAATDLAYVWAFTSNVIPASFWYLFETVSRDSLLQSAKEQVSTSKTSAGILQAGELAKNPLLQSIYAETLRLHTASLLTRTSKRDHKIDSWIIPKDQYVMVATQVEHRSPYWNTVDPETGSRHSPYSFYPERFLTKDEDGNVEFSMEGKQGRWLPYGMGEHMCPGRHFAKYEMLLVFAVIVDVFDIELMTPTGWKPEDDMSRYGLGATRPKQEVKFRIRQRASSL